MILAMLLIVKKIAEVEHTDSVIATFAEERVAAEARRPK